MTGAADIARDGSDTTVANSGRKRPSCSRPPLGDGISSAASTPAPSALVVIRTTSCPRSARACANCRIWIAGPPYRWRNPADGQDDLHRCAASSGAQKSTVRLRESGRLWVPMRRLRQPQIGCSRTPVREPIVPFAQWPCVADLRHHGGPCSTNRSKSLRTARARAHPNSGGRLTHPCGRTPVSAATIRIRPARAAGSAGGTTNPATPSGHTRPDVAGRLCRDHRKAGRHRLFDHESVRVAKRREYKTSAAA